MLQAPNLSKVVRYMDTDVKIEIEMGHVKIPVNVNNQGPFNFVLDTGASFTTLSTRLAEKLGIESRKDDRPDARGVGGGVPTLFADAKIGVGSLVFDKDEVYVLDLDAILRVPGSRDGVLGYTTLKQCTMSLSYSKQKLTLHKGESSRNLNWTPFEYINDSHLIGIPVYINGKGPHNFVLDTGAGNTVITPELATKLGLNAQPVQGIARGVRGDVQLELAAVDTLSVGSAQISNNQVVVIDLSKVSPKGKLIENGIIGFDFLKNFETIIDYPQKKLSFIDERS